MNKNPIHAYNVKEKLALGVGFFVLFFLGQAINVLAIPYYQMTLGINPSYLAILMALPILVAGTLSPIVGHWSDNCSSQYGRRKPFLGVASIFCCITYGMIWMVPAGWSSTHILVYFGVTCLLFHLASIFYSVPLNSLIYEMSASSRVRTELLGFTTYFVKVGSLSYQWVFPLSHIIVFAGVALGVQYVGWGLAVIVFGVLGMIPALLLREPEQKKDDAIKKEFFLKGLIVALNTKGMPLVLSLIFLQMGGAAFSAAMDYYLLVYFVHAGDIAAGSITKGVLSTAYAIVSIISVPLLLRLVNKLGKLQALGYVYCINAFGGFLKWFIFVPNAGWFVVCDAMLCGVIWSAMVIIIPAMMSDLAHADASDKPAIRAGIFAAIHGWALSISAVLALLMGGFTLSAIQFDSALGAAQHPSTILWMRIILAGGTLLFSVIPLWLMQYKKMTEPFASQP